MDLPTKPILLLLLFQAALSLPQQQYFYVQPQPVLQLLRTVATINILLKVHLLFDKLHQSCTCSSSVQQHISSYKFSPPSPPSPSTTLTTAKLRLWVRPASPSSPAPAAVVLRDDGGGRDGGVLLPAVPAARGPGLRRRRSRVPERLLRRVLRGQGGLRRVVPVRRGRIRSPRHRHRSRHTGGGGD